MVVDKYSKPTTPAPRAAWPDVVPDGRYTRNTTLINRCKPVVRIFSPVVAIVLFTGWLSISSVHAQTDVAGLVPHVDLTSSLNPGPDAPSMATALLGVSFSSKGPSDGKLFDDAAPEEKGWKGLATLLEALTPSIDTDIPLTSAQITERISKMLDEGQNEEALRIIEQRSAQLQEQGAMGTDVQLLFLHGRALSALGRHNEAIEIYRDMTTLYPELPEPWNNLAAEYVRQGKLHMAQDALNMSLAANPNYATARANLGEVQLMLARASFQDAARLGVAPASSKAAATADILRN